AETLTLDHYLENVKSGNSEARSTLQTISSLQLRLDEGDIPLMPQLYGDFSSMDDQKPTAVPLFMGTETRVTQWKTGLKKQTEYGLGADLSFVSQRTIVYGVTPS